MGRKPVARPLPKVLRIPFSSDLDGLASKRRNMILLADTLRPFTLLETTVHEALHLADWKASERKVTARARYIARILWKQGYRISK
jgi:hypothetical protein